MKETSTAHQDQRETLLWLLSWEGKKSVECASNIHIFKGLAEGLVSFLPDSEHLWNWHTLDTWGSQRTKENQWLVTAPENLWYHRQTPEEQRDYKLQGKSWQTSLMGNPRKGLRGSQNLWPCWLVKSFPVQSQTIKSERGNCVFKYIKLNTNLDSILKNRDITLPKRSIYSKLWIFQ